MRINHFDEAPSNASPESDPSEEAFGRLIEFVFSDEDLVNGLFSEEGPSEEQTQKLASFLVKDPFYQEKIFNDIENNEETSWFKDLSQDAKIRFIEIATSVPASQLESEESSKLVVEKLLADSEIGPVLRNHYGDNVSSELLADAQKAVSSKSLRAHHNFAKIASHLSNWHKPSALH